MDCSAFLLNILYKTKIGIVRRENPQIALVIATVITIFCLSKSSLLGGRKDRKGEACILLLVDIQLPLEGFAR